MFFPHDVQCIQLVLAIVGGWAFCPGLFVVRLDVETKWGIFITIFSEVWLKFIPTVSSVIVAWRSRHVLMFSLRGIFCFFWLFRDTKDSTLFVTTLAPNEDNDRCMQVIVVMSCHGRKLFGFFFIYLLICFFSHHEHSPTTDDTAIHVQFTRHTRPR